VPRYRYKCTECQHDCEVTHSISEKLTDCEKCKLKNTLKRIPFLMRIKKEGSSKTGDVVKQFIKDAKEDVSVEKKNFAKEYEP